MSRLDMPDNLVAALHTVRTIARAPIDLVGLPAVLSGIHASIHAAVIALGYAPSHTVIGHRDAIAALIEVINGALAKQGIAVVDTDIQGRSLVSYAAWRLFGLLRSGSVAQVLIAAGTEYLMSLVANKGFALGHADDLRRALKSEDHIDLAQVLRAGGKSHDYPDGPAWIKRCLRQWPGAIRSLTVEGPDLPPEPPLPPGIRAARQIEQRAQYPSVPHRGGELTHRHLSRGQLLEIGRRVRSDLDGREPRGLLAVIDAMTGLSTDLLGELPVSEAQVAHWCVRIDPRMGAVVCDLSCLAPDAPSVGEYVGTVEATLTSVVPLPRSASDLLVDLHDKSTPPTSGPITLGQLIPLAHQLRPTDPIYLLGEEIVPSWARWRQSLGIYARQIGIDNILAAQLTLDFGHVPRSKLHYAAVPRHETWEACRKLCEEMGWGEPVGFVPGAGFGTCIVPTLDHLRRIRLWQSMWLTEYRPRTKASLQQLVEFHRRYASVCAFLLSVVMGLRQATTYDLKASIDEARDLCVVINDKNADGFGGGLPIPLTSLARDILSNWRTHCAGLASRLAGKHMRETPLARWAERVARKDDVPLLCLGGVEEALVAVGSSHAMDAVPGGLRVPVDAGRKILETHLRGRLPTTAIDGLLRHEVTGQSRWSGGSNHRLGDWALRADQAFNSVLRPVLAPIDRGLGGA